MSATLLATACPALQTPAAMLSLASAYSTDGGNAPTAKTFSDGMTSALRQCLNANASRLDLATRYGGGGYAIATGLALSAPGSGLNLNVAAGHALIDGPVEIASATTVAVPNSSPRVWVWLTQAGALTAVNNSLTPPAGAVCLLGSCVTSGGNITSVDTSGVLYIRGGTLWRETGDTGAPTDTPPNSLTFLHKTAGGLWLWDGAAYRQIGTNAYDLAAFVGGKPTASQICLRFVAVRAVVLPASLAGSQVKAGTAATSTANFDVKVNGTSKGTLSFAASGTSATFTFSTAVTLAAGDVLTIVAPSSQDATLADVGFTLAATY